MMYKYIGEFAIMKKGISIYQENEKRIVKGIGYYDFRKINDLRELIKTSAQRYGNKIGFKFKNREGSIVGKTYTEFDNEIDCLGTALISMGLKGSHISIISENRYEWGLCYFSIINGTGVAVPLDKYLPQNEVENLIQRGNVEVIFYSAAFHEMMTKIAATNDNIKYFICMENIETDKNQDLIKETNLPDENRIFKSKFITLNKLIETGKELLSNQNREFIDAKIDSEKLSILLFTSGTTNMSKGVMLSHKNIASNVMAITTDLHVKSSDVHLSLLPLHHTFENTIGLMFMVYSGVTIAYTDGIRYLAQNLKEYEVSILVAVPAIFEAMYSKIQDGVKKAGKTELIKLMIKLSQGLRVFGIDFRRVFFKSIFKQIGPKLRLAVSGAAPLDPSFVIGFDKLGLRLVEGYGLTETSPVVAANNDFVLKPGTIGHPLGGIEVSILSPDETGLGEIITRGSNVMLGYFNDPVATKEVIDSEGWFRTGDLGNIDQDGFIKVTGRAKSMIVFTNGKKAFPEEYETILNRIPSIKESYVWGNVEKDGDVRVCAKLVLNKEWLLENKPDLLSENNLKAEFELLIKEINKSLPQYKIIRYFLLSFNELVKTTTLKIKRPIEDEKIKKFLQSEEIEMRKASGRLI